MNENLIIIVVGATLSAIVAVIAYFIRRLIASVDKLEATIHTLSDKVGVQNGRVGRLEEWRNLHKEEVTIGRVELNEKFKEIKDDVKDLEISLYKEIK